MAEIQVDQGIVLWYTMLLQGSQEVVAQVELGDDVKIRLGEGSRQYGNEVVREVEAEQGRYVKGLLFNHLNRVVRQVNDL
jgi:hypothetical protein